MRLRDGDEFGPLEAVATPGHAPDHLAFVLGTVAFTGDAVLGEGSVFIAPDPGALAGYLDGLARPAAPAIWRVLCPGPRTAGARPRRQARRVPRPPARPRAPAAGGAARRASGRVDELLDDVWDDAPAALRPAATVTLAAHLDKLADEGRLPAGVERPGGWSDCRLSRRRPSG